MKDIVINIFLLWGSIQDMKTKKISSYYIYSGWILSVVFIVISIYNQTFNWTKWCYSLVPGIIFLIAAKVTKEQVGYGDGYVFLFLGNLYQNIKVWTILEISVILSAVFSIYLILIKKTGRKKKIPFLPFIWISQVVVWGINYV